MATRQYCSTSLTNVPHAVGSPVLAAVFPESGSVLSPEVYGGCQLRLEFREQPWCSPPS